MSDFTLPAIGETVALYGGTITRLDARRFVVVRADGKLDRGCNSAAKPELRYVVAVNILRRHAGLELLPVPCLHCVEKPRRGTNCFCSGQCEALHYGRAPRPERKVKARFSPEEKAAAYADVQRKSHVTPERPMPSHEAIMERLAQFAEAHEPKAEPVKEQDAKRLSSEVGAPSLHDARVKADALIRKRGGKAPREGYCKPEHYERRQAQEQTP